MVAAVDADHCSHADALSDGLFTSHTLICEGSVHDDGLLRARSGLAHVDHHRGVHRIDRDPLVPAVHVAVSEPAPSPNWRAHQGAFRCVLDEPATSYPFAASPHVV